MIYECSSCAGSGRLQGQEICEDCNDKGYIELTPEQEPYRILQIARRAMRKYGGVPVEEWLRSLGVEIVPEI